MSPPYGAETTGEQLVQDFASQIKGKVILTTGVSPGGLGAFFVETISKAQPALLILAGRDTTKVQKTADTITAAHKDVKVRVLKLDLASLKQTREAAATVNSWTDIPHIDMLMNNAGIMACDYGKTEEGFERQFATNHLGPFLFTNLIIEKLLAASKPRVVAVSSDGHRLGAIRFADYNFGDGETYNRWRSYGQSKTANMLMALSLAEKLGKRGLNAYSLHPGVIITNLGAKLDWDADFGDLRKLDRVQGNREGWSDFKFKTGDGGSGVATHVYAAFDPSLSGHNGAYLQDCHVGDPWTDTVKPWATSGVEAERLWVLSEKLVGETFKY
ncbi:NAD(P)-binding protein [Mytilinidion resinicola]|uniref:NAD(P)-binding protein n=1 Tax=Mytilinidion resinicola TaxID=574789 RepID=A0A6A6Y754_9PEZI|nr:NAD(P)-binding protein [Mytilinidion resinicola]KAF2803637.1 NAD(P)-binding protein [Mytilinidion resinicola]